MATPTKEVLLPGLVSRCTEFVYDAHENRTITGDCGPDALAEGVAWADQVLCTASYVAATYDTMRANGECDPNGPSTIGGLEHAATRMKLPGVERIGFAQPLPMWEQWCHDRVGAKAIVIEVSNGQALTDYLTSKGENASHLQYHYILLVGYNPGGVSARVGRTLPEGWWVADGDNFDQGDILQYYPATVLRAAAPCAALAFNGRVAPRSTPVDTNFYGLTTTNDPEVWACAQYKTTLGHGFLKHYQSLSAPAYGACATQILGLPISNEYTQGALIRQDFERGYLLYDQSKANPWMIVHGVAGLDLRAAAQQISQLTGQVKSATDAATAAQAAQKAAEDALAAAQAASSGHDALVAQVQALGPACSNVAGALAAVENAAHPADALTKLAELPDAVNPLVVQVQALIGATLAK